MGLRLDILNINFRGARKTLNKTPRGRFLTPRKFARVPVAPKPANFLARGAAPALEVLCLSGNKIGDEGVRHLSDALARGAAPKLRTLLLKSNPATDADKLIFYSHRRANGIVIREN